MVQQASSQPTDRSGTPPNPPSSSLSPRIDSFAHAAEENKAPISNDELTPKAGDAAPFLPLASSQRSCVPILVHKAVQPSASFSSSHPHPTLHIRTDLVNTSHHVDPASMVMDPADSFDHRSLSATSLPTRTPSLHASCAPPLSSAGSISPSSVISSPRLTAVGDVTPLPSPIVSNAGLWKLDRQVSSSRTPSRSPSSSLLQPDPAQTTQMPVSSSFLPRTRSKQYPALDRVEKDHPERPRRLSLVLSPVSENSRNRSISDCIPTATGIRERRSDNGTLPESGGVAKTTALLSTDINTNDLHREHYLAVDRGIVVPTARPPTPPRSSSGSYVDRKDEPVVANISYQNFPQEIYFVRSIQTHQLRKYRKIRELGQGTFSQVILGVRVESGNDDGPRRYFSLHAATAASQKLVAVKIVEFGPAGGADEGRVEVSLKREVDVLKSVNHPSLVQLKAFGSDERRALLVLDYCPGGDLFDFASSPLNKLSPDLIRRVFAELVDAVLYLHRNYIVHRDIKLESKHSHLQILLYQSLLT